MQEYIFDLISKLGLEDLPEEHREKVLQLLQERFSQVIFLETHKFLPENLKQEYLEASKAGNEEKIALVTAQAPGLSVALEKALLLEFQSLKNGLGKLS
jgi:hypothetical protein